MNQISHRKIEQDSIFSAYLDLQTVITRNFDHRMWLIAEACCSVIATLMLKDSFNPVGLILVDNPSTGKTTALSMFYDLDMVYRSDNFTPSAFVSHASNVKKEMLGKIDLLPRIRYKCLIVPELAPIFGQRPDELLRSISILTRIFDGEGYWSDSGAHGGRGYKGDYYFTMLGATLPMPKAVWKTLGQFGSRLLFLTLACRQDAADRMAKSYLNVFDSGLNTFGQRLQECRNAVNTFFVQLKSFYSVESYHRSITWDSQEDSREIKVKINLLAEFTSRARSKITVWDKSNSKSDTKMEFSQPAIEGAERLVSILYSLARGHALICGRTQLTATDLQIVVDVALSSMPDDRRQVVQLLLNEPDNLKTEEKGAVSSSDIERSLPVSKPTALKLIELLDHLEIGEKKEGVGRNPAILRLNSIYNWLLSPELADYRRSSDFLV